MNLSTQGLASMPSLQHVPTPRYDRDNTCIGIVHIGPGAFHRAHQAVYTENAMNLSGGHWRICGVSLRSSDARDALVKQDYLYTLAIQDERIEHQVIGAIKEILVAGEQNDAIFQRLKASSTRIVSLTITEKGYCLNADGTLDLQHPDIVADLSKPLQPCSAIGFLVEGLRLRRLSQTQAYAVLSCDNISGNGDKLRNAVVTYARQLDHGLAAWIAEHVAFPNSMVDCITPKTEGQTIASVSAATGLVDNWPVQREAFSQWVIDSAWHGERPDWASAGVVFTDNIEGFEKAKLRLLNCLHSSLAYCGSLAGYTTVYEAASDPNLHRFITQLAQTEIIGSFTAPEQLNVTQYSRDIIGRFLNPGIRHLLAQIAWDGSQKIQERLLPTIQDNLILQRPTNGLCLSLAAWFEFICRALHSGEEIVDPLAADFTQMSGLGNSDPAETVKSFLEIETVFGSNLINNKVINDQLTSSLALLRDALDTGKGITRSLPELRATP